jgi:hypothetical protein
MIDERLTDELARLALGWRAAPGRFLKLNKSWTPKWKFCPLDSLSDAFYLLERAARAYALTSHGGTFTATVQIGDREGHASGRANARTVSLAVARALGLEVSQ